MDSPQSPAGEQAPDVRLTTMLVTFMGLANNYLWDQFLEWWRHLPIPRKKFDLDRKQIARSLVRYLHHAILAVAEVDGIRESLAQFNGTVSLSWADLSFGGAPIVKTKRSLDEKDELIVLLLASWLRPVLQAQIRDLADDVAHLSRRELEVALLAAAQRALPDLAKRAEMQG